MRSRLLTGTLTKTMSELAELVGGHEPGCSGGKRTRTAGPQARGAEAARQPAAPARAASTGQCGRNNASCAATGFSGPAS